MRNVHGTKAASMSTETNMMRTFILIRDHDATGISGTGPVADGVLFPDGTVVMRWRDLEGAATGVRPTTVVHESITAVEALHGHGGSTRIAWGAQTATCKNCHRVIGSSMPLQDGGWEPTWVHTEGRQRYLVRCDTEDSGEPYGLDAEPLMIDDGK